MALEGTHFVRVLRSALHSARSLWPHTRDRMEVRRHVLKLRFWGMRHDPTNTVLDVTYESIKSLPGMGVYEMRIDDEIGGKRNIRVLYFDPPSSWVPIKSTPLPVLWILEALTKKRQEWTAADLHRFSAKRAIVRERFYSGG